MPTQETAELLNAAEAAAILGCSDRTVLRLIDSGQLRYVRKLPGKTGNYLFARADVERLAAEKASA